MPEAEVRRWCDVHVAVFKESLNQQGPPESIPGRPVHTLRMENRAVGQLMEKPRSTLATLVDGRGLESGREPMKGQLKQLSAIDKQYLRKENQLFPLLERRGVQDPPKVMWGVHDQIRDMLKEARALAEGDDPGALRARAGTFAGCYGRHFLQRGERLSPMSMETWSKTGLDGGPDR